MARDFVSLPSLQGVAANATATLEIPIGPAYHDLQLTYTTGTGGGATLVNMSAELTEFRLKVDGVVQVVRSGSTNKEIVKAGVKRLRRAHAPLLGSVLNRTDVKSKEYAYY